MNVAQLRMWNITLPIGNHRYHDEGYVDSLRDAARKVYQSYGDSESDPFIHKLSRGFYIGKGLDVHVMYLRSPSTPLDIQNRAHEEFHAADYCYGLDFLSSVTQEKGTPINFKEIEDEQVRANVGALFVLDQNGFSSRDLGKYRKYQEMAPAVEIWNKVKPPKKRFFFPFFWRRGQKNIEPIVYRRIK